MAFNLADVLKDVSNSDTGREQIEYISLSLIDEDPNNFYQLSDLDELAANIAFCGLQQPIRVRQKKDGRYIIVSGHRRRAAVAMLAVEDPQRWQEVSCIVERDEVSPSLQQLRLIYANSNTRKMTAAEISQQAEQVEKLLYQLKEEGYDFPGRMRDHVAEAVQVSKSKLARLKVIRENLDESWVDAWKTGTLTESQAYELAQMPRGWQCIIKANWPTSIQSLYADRIRIFRERFNELADLKCDHGLQLCEHSSEMMKKNAGTYYNFPCTRCCFDCSSLQSCKNCCPEAAGKKKELRDIAKAANQRAKAEREERDRPGAEFARTVWDRIGKARLENRVSVEQVFKAQKRFYSASVDDKEQRKMETGNGDYSPTTELPFGYNVQAETVMKIRDVADSLGCSIDYLLGRTDRMEIVSESDTDSKPEKVSYSGTYWQAGNPKKIGKYLCRISFGKYFDDKFEMLMWNGCEWHDGSQIHEPEYDGDIIGWIPRPKEAEEAAILNGSCITGMSPNGTCGAAACCDNEYTCCLQCDKDCNSRCGWIDDTAEVMTE